LRGIKEDYYTSFSRFCRFPKHLDLSSKPSLGRQDILRQVFESEESDFALQCASHFDIFPNFV
jgi:hypothetical protein